MRHPLLAALLVLGLPLAPASAQPLSTAGAKAQDPPPPPLPPPPARVWLIAPSPGGPWTLRIDNEGAHPIRVAADVRLLELEIEVPGDRRTQKKVRCAAPPALRPSGFPERRALLLAPGHSYIESFDPHLLCFGKDAAVLAGSSVIRPWLGWSLPPKWSRKPPAAPFMAESTDAPPAFAPSPGLRAPAMVLSYGLPAQPAADKPADDKPAADKPAADKPAADKPAAPEPIVDANAPRLELTADAFADAASPRAVSVRLKAKNVGHRAMTVALRSRMLEFQVEGPDGVTTCAASPPTGSVPRDLYRTLKPGATVDFQVLLKEVCPQGAFEREGLYRVTATLHASESGADVGVDGFTAVVPAEKATLVRVQSAPNSFYSTPPRAVPTPAPPDLTE